MAYQAERGVSLRPEYEAIWKSRGILDFWMEAEVGRSGDTSPPDLPAGRRSPLESLRSRRVGAGPVSWRDTVFLLFLDTLFLPLRDSGTLKSMNTPLQKFMLCWGAGDAFATQDSKSEA